MSLDRGAVFGAALLARLAVAGWAASHVVPAADAVYYHRLATRLASGQGYTWLWPDGAVTYAAHYPVGYPWLLSLGYRLLGPEPAVGALLNALIGAAGALAVHELVRREAGRRAALLAGLLAALDPAQLLYTPALMTEGVTGSLLAAAATLLFWPGRASFAAGSALLGVSVLIRPQCLLAAPLLGALALGPGVRARALGALASTAGALLVCLPWTLRNCVRMKSCALVSVNGGWNLLIGASPGATGHWVPLDVPPACREVFDEAAKDACFGKAAREMIASDAGRWLSLVPKKLAATFDYCGAGPWYLHDASPLRFTHDDKVAAGTVETAVHRLMLLLALAGLARAGGGGYRWGIAALGGLLALQRAGWMSYAALALLAALVGWGDRVRYAGALAAVLGSTLAVHAAFFGAGRYSLVVFPLLCAAVGGLLTEKPHRGDTAPHAPD